MKKLSATHRPSGLHLEVALNLGGKEQCIFIDLSGGAFTSIHTQAGARSLARFLHEVADKISWEWASEVGKVG